MSTKMEISEDLLLSVKNLPRPTLVGVSGFGGSGKSSVARKLSEAWDAPVVGVDSFQKKGAFDTQFSLWEIMDFSRLEKEVLEPFSNGEDVRYGHFDASKEVITHTVQVRNTGMLIVEGVGLFRPELVKYFTYKIWIDTPIDEAIARGKKRDREEHERPTDDLWDNVWKVNDLEYYSKFNPAKNADWILENK